MRPGWYPSNPYRDRGDEPPQGGRRPVNQGDVFKNVPLIFGVSADGKARQKRKTTILLPHPCATRKGGSGRLNDLLCVSPVSRLSSVASEWGPPWEGHFALFPLPGLLNGEDWVADLGLAAIVRSEGLQESRIAVLSREGFTAFQARCAHNACRVEPDPVRLRNRAEDYWLEFDLWERWTEVLGTEDGFQSWLDGPAPERPETARRDAIKLLYDEIRVELDAELARQQI
jgi:hypothetical protein